MPHRDLRLSADHSLFLEEALIPARYLINGAGITVEAEAGTTYFHIELPAHGVLLEDLGNAPAALAAYQRALEGDPALADCHFNLARLYEALGKPQRAIRHLGQYRRIVSREAR